MRQKCVIHFDKIFSMAAKTFNAFNLVNHQIQMMIIRSKYHMIAENPAQSQEILKEARNLSYKIQDQQLISECTKQLNGVNIDMISQSIGMYLQCLSTPFIDISSLEEKDNSDDENQKQNPYMIKGQMPCELSGIKNLEVKKKSLFMFTKGIDASFKIKLET